MIPIVMARHIREGLVDYLETTYPMANKPFQGSIKFLAEAHDGLTLDPFVSIKLPFRVGDRKDFPFPDCLHPPYDPYIHQLEAFTRIGNGESTLVATGTGSGKTECFLYPILQYCYKQRRLGNTGIKAILVYPMNALAADQAKRIAKLIHDSPELRNNVTAGMYVGKTATDEHETSTAMSEQSIITDHGALLRNPPDILLTNYKMLDYLLIRPQDSRLWDGNEPETLKYFVVDELHTFDGAQGTDLACLIRRLSDRMQTPCEDICFVGTSATMGSGPEDAKHLCDFASAVFNTPFTPESIITENRLDAAEFFDGEEPIHLIPSGEQALRLRALELNDDDPDVYLSEACRAILGQELPEPDAAPSRVRLATWLKRSDLLRQFVIALHNEPHMLNDDLRVELGRQFQAFSRLRRHEQVAVLDALVALVSHARIDEHEDGNLRPFLDVQVQLWTKELRQMRASVCGPDETVQYGSLYELDTAQSKQYLPIVNCRICGNTGWVGSINERTQRIEAGEKSFVNIYFQFRSNALAVMRPWSPTDMLPSGHAELGYFCPNADCMRFTHTEQFDAGERTCPTCGTNRIPMQILGLESVGNERKHYRCPFCGSDADLALLGFRATPQMSVMLTELIGDRYNDDDKTIVFSDSVQDAAFRASAFNSRTWRFALRNNAVDYLEHQWGGKASLADYLDKQSAYHHTMYADDIDFIMRFTPANMTWMDEYRRAANKQSGQRRHDLIEQIDKRLRIETLHELGSRSRIGRTLEKTGCAAIGYDERTLETIAQDTQARVRAELGDDVHLEADGDWLHMALDMLNALRMDGAFVDSLYKQYIEEGGNPFLLSNKHLQWMPGSYVKSEPHFLTDTKTTAKTGFVTLSTSRYMSIVNGYLTNEVMLAGNQPRIILDQLLQACMAHGVIVARACTQGRFGVQRVYGIDESQCYVVDDVIALHCDSCGRTYDGARDNEQAWIGLHCRNPYCRGRLMLDDARQDWGYYHRLYHTAPPVARIHAAEHTGLVDAETRNKLESQFKQSNASAGDVNVLACTPTLEMGIDIGDLSTVILSSIPPNQSQYLQRVGRAGRRDGNALVLAVANSRPHDRYFYNRAQEMIGGHVQPPHVFLQASAVLERQLTAFAMDRWVHACLMQGMEPKDIIRRKLAYSLDVMDAKTNGFPLTFLEYTRTHTAELLQAFHEMFSTKDTAIDAALEQSLRLFLEGGTTGVTEHPTLTARIATAFEAAKHMIEHLETQQKELEQLKKEFSDKPQDPSTDVQIHECTIELKVVENNIRAIKKTNVFNFMCNEGILPNYAFPEGGVTLHTVLKADPESEVKTADATGKHTKRIAKKTQTGSYERPAMTAITELAPGNTFYAQGHKFAINRVLYDDGVMNTDVPPWRLCPNCSHAEPKSVDNNATCPVCGDPRWAENGQCMPMLRISNVISEETYRESLIDEGDDTRSRSMFQTDMLVDVKREDVKHAWKLNGDTDFGYEYVPHGTLREINFGEADNQGAKMTVNGMEEIRKGFLVCSSCGALADKNGRIPPKRHAYTCPNRRGLEKTDGQQCLFLYREFNTEMLRLLVPGIADTRGGNAAAASFSAAIMLGLRNKFGNIDHLNAVLSNEPALDGTNIRKTYLVIFDEVPGGTGYLKQLGADSDAMVEVLRNAFTVIDECDYCHANNTDGCYNCLLGWRQERQFDAISRSLALDMLGPIINDAHSFEPVTTVSDISVNHLLDSALEQQFLEALSRTCSQPLTASYDNRGARCTWAKNYSLQHGEGYLLTVNGAKWEIDLQVDLGPEQGVAVSCRPDFIISRADDDEGSKIAIFTDGLQFHAPIMGEDTLKREALRRAGYRVWTLTYDDVMGFLNQTAPNSLADPMLDINTMPWKEACRKLMRQHKVSDIDPGRYGTMDLLAFQLTDVNAEDKMKAVANAISWGLFDRKHQRASTKPTAFEHAMGDLTGLRDSELARCSVYNPDHDYDRLSIYSYATQEDGLEAIARILLHFNDALASDGQVPDPELWETYSASEREDFKRQWSSFWHLANVLQYSGYLTFVTDFAIDAQLYLPLIEQAIHHAHTAAIDVQTPDGGDWQSVLENENFQYLGEPCQEQVRKLARMHLVVPDAVASEALDAEGVSLGEAALIWDDARFVFIPDDYIDDTQTTRDAYEADGWTVITDVDERQVEPLRHSNQ